MFTRVNLYKNCILTSRNTEVFRTAELLETYLGTLDKPYIADIDIANVYTTLSGDITIDATPLNGDFNYIKFQEFDDNNQVKQTVYAFIDSFRIVNDLLVISYSTDIWHTYIGKWTLRDSNVERSSVLLEGEPYNIPLFPINNGEVKVHTVIPSNYSGTINGDFAIICKMQFYLLESGGQPQTIAREGYGVYRFLQTPVNNEYTEFNPITSIETLSSKLDTIMAWQQNKRWLLPGSSVSYYCFFSEVYVVPANWIEDFDLFHTNINNIYKYQKTSNLFDYFNFFSYGSNGLRTIRHNCHNYSINGYYSNIDYYDKSLIKSIGLFTKQIPYQFNGLDKYASIEMSLTPDTINFYLAYETTLIDITDEFSMRQDYTIVTPDVLAQREIAKKQQTIQGITGIINDVSQIAVGVASIAAGNLAGGVGFGGNEAFEKAIGWNLPSSSGATPSSIMHQASGGAGIVGGITNAVNHIAQISFANKAKYMGFTTANNYTAAILNAWFGFCFTVGDTIVNQNEVDKAISEVGYEVDYFTNNLDINNSQRSKMAIKFSFVRLTGLSTEICEMIASILMNGVKIWYTANV